MALPAGLKPLSYDPESNVEDRTEQPVDMGDLCRGENVPEGGTIRMELGVLRINLNLGQVLRWGGAGSSTSYSFQKEGF